MKKTTAYPALVLSLLLSSSLFAQEKVQTAMAVKVTQAMKSDIRANSEIDRDRNRKPVQTLDFLSITPDMKVLELIPGGGWYTKLLAPSLRESGELHVAIGVTRIKNNVLKLTGMDKVSVLEPEVEISDGKDNLRTINAFSLEEKNFDAVLTFRNMHNFDAAGRANINNAVFNALKKGGVYGVVDHTRRHMEPINSENRRRADPVTIIKELLDSGFEFVGYSNLHFKSDDELRFEVGRKTVTGNSDRFTFLFKKP